MENFQYYAPTKVIFERGAENHVGTELKSTGVKKVLVHFGGGSVKRSGLLERITQKLTENEIQYVLCGGVEPNPKVSLVRKGIAICKQEQVDFLLAVGGGSVIDSTKAIAHGYANNCDPWEDYILKGAQPTKTTPFGVVLTLAAAGSEMSNSMVLTDDATQTKRGLSTDQNRPLVAFLNPELTFTVSKFQTGCGIVDTMMHTLERYCVPNGGGELTDRIAESLLISVKHAGLKAIENPCDYDARATLMWASSLSHNGLTGCGVKFAFTVHKLEHDFSGLHDNIAHGAGLSVLFPAWAKQVYLQDTARFAQLAVRVWDCEMDTVHPEKTALEGITRMQAYFAQIGMPTTMREIGITPDDYEAIVNKTTNNGTKTPPSCYGEMTKERILEIYRLAE